MRTVVVHLCSAELCTQLTTRLVDVARIEVCAHLRHLEAVASHMRPAVIVCELPVTTPPLLTTLRLLAALRERPPYPGVLVAFRAGRYTVRTMTTAFQLGLDDAVLLSHEDLAAAITRLLPTSSLLTAWRDIRDALASHLSPVAMTLVAVVLRRSAARVSVEQLARTMRVSRRTLLRRCRAAGLPAPEALIAWCRLLVALEMAARRPRVALDQIAHECGYSNASDLHTRLGRHTELTLGQVTERGGLALEFVRRYGRVSDRREDRGGVLGIETSMQHANETGGEAQA